MDFPPAIAIFLIHSDIELKIQVTPSKEVTNMRLQAQFSVSYQILSADDPIEISGKCQDSPRKYLSLNNEQGIACSAYRVFIIQISSFTVMVKLIFMRV